MALFNFQKINTINHNQLFTEKKPLPVYGLGKNIRDWLYVNDHCRAIYKVLRKGGVVGETYNIGGNNEIKNIDVVTKSATFWIDSKLLENGKKYSGND